MLIAQLTIFVILVLALCSTLANLIVFKSLPSAEVPVDAPKVSVLVPARNESLNIEACVGSLLRQDYPNYEVIVLDDHSDDGTSEIVSRLFAARPDVQTRLLKGTPLPEAWTGKGWACHQLAAGATGDYLFFTDADTTHAPGLLAAAVAHSQKTGASLMSAWPRFITVTLGEKLIVPTIALIGLAFALHWMVALL
jgi:chlorobactene glucosyltransferase